MFSDDFLNGLQATFLQPLISPPPIGPLSLNEEPQKASEVKEEEFGRVGLRTELEALSLDDLERRCRINGLVSKVTFSCPKITSGNKPQLETLTLIMQGKPSALIHRLLALDLYLMPLERQPQSQAVAPAHDTAKAPEGEADLGTVLKSSDGKSELRTNQDKDGAGLKSDAAVGGMGSSKSCVSSWTVVEEEKEENREKTADMFKVSQWIREEQEAMERERKKLEDVVGDDSGDIFDGLSKGKRVREEQEVAETEVKRMKQ